LKKTGKKLKYYIDNEKFINELTKYKEHYNNNLKKGLDKPKISDYLGLCFMKISEGLASTRSYNKYPFIEDLIGDGVYFCIKYMHNFDPSRISKPTDAFNYFTMIVYHAFLQRISKEKKYLYVKYKSIQKAEMNSMTYASEGDDTFDIEVAYSDEARSKMEEFLDNYEKKNLTKLKK